MMISLMAQKMFLTVLINLAAHWMVKQISIFHHTCHLSLMNTRATSLQRKNIWLELCCRRSWKPLLSWRMILAPLMSYLTEWEWFLLRHPSWDQDGFHYRSMKLLKKNLPEWHVLCGLQTGQQFDNKGFLSIPPYRWHYRRFERVQMVLHFGPCQWILASTYGPRRCWEDGFHDPVWIVPIQKDALWPG